VQLSLLTNKKIHYFHHWKLAISGAGTTYLSGAPEVYLFFFKFLCIFLYIIACPFSFGHYIVFLSSIDGF
jgi:hypothetical protein